MKGFRGKVVKEAKESTRAAGREVTREFGKSGVQAGKSMGDGFRNGSRTAELALKDLSRANASATQTWAKDSRSHKDALGQVRVAQAKLNDAVQRYGKDSVQAITGQERLASAQRRVEETGNRVLASTVKMKDAQSALAKGQDAVKRAQEGTAAAAERTGSRMSRALTGARNVAQQAASGMGRAFAPVWAGIQRGAATAGRVIGDSIKVGSAVAGAAVAGLLGKTLLGGFNRLTSIENAQAKMKGLGFAAKDIQSAMDGASEAVDGTAYSLDEMASAASVAMAAGLKPGEELNRYMATLKNAAAAANVPLSEMSPIMNKVVTAQKAYTTEINQIADRGLPIWSKLQEEYGVTADELRDMVSRGEVDAETFFKVMDDMTGSVADAMGDTTQAKIRNFGTALNKLGATMLGGLYPVLGPLFEAMKSGVQMIEAVVKPAFEGLGGTMASPIQKLTDFSTKWGEIKEKIAAGGDPLALITEQWPRFGGVLEKLVKGIERIPDTLKFLSDAFGQLSGAMGPILEQLGPVFAEALKTLWDALAPILPELGETLLDAITELAPPLVELLAALVPLVPPLVDLLVAILPVVSAIVDLLVPALEWLIEKVTPVFEAIDILIGYLKGDIGQSEFITKLQELGGGFGEMYKGIYDVGVQIGYAVGKVVQFFKNAGDSIKSAWQAVTTFLQNVLTNISNFFRNTWTNISNTVRSIFSGISSTISSIMNNVRNAISNALNGARSVVSNVLAGIRNTWVSVWNGIASFFWGIVSGIQSAIGQIGGAVSGIASTVWNALGNVGSWLVNSGRALIQGFIDGISGMIGKVGDAVGGIVEWARGFFPNSPAKRGPLSGSGWSRLKRSGDAYIQQWIAGVNEGADGFDPDLPFDPFGPGNGPRGGGGGRPGVAGRPGSGAAPGGGSAVNIYGNVYGNPQEVADEIERKQRRASALYGVGSIR